MGGPVARLRRDLDPDEARRQRPLLLRLRRRRRARRDRLLRRVEPPVRRRRQQGHDADRRRSRSTCSSPATRARRGRTASSAPSSPGSPASRPAARPTSTSATSALSADGAGKLVVPLRRRDDGRRHQTIGRASARPTAGATWSGAGDALDGRRGGDRRRRSSRAARATSGPGTCQTSGGGNVDAWNVWYRRSTDGGATWAAPVEDLRRDGGCGVQDRGRLRARSTATTARSAITNTGKTIAIWGEGASYDGPGGVWFNRQP